MRGYWDRDLAIDLDAIKAWGAKAIVTLLEPQELTPIVDVSVPDNQFEDAWLVAGGELRSLLCRRLDVLVHCRGGLGRAGTIAARLLVELGMPPVKAIKSVRAVRPGAIETRDQEKFRDTD